jgi:hypothetical protein
MSISPLSQCLRYTIRCSKGHLAAAGEAIVTVTNPEEAELFVDLDSAFTRARNLSEFFPGDLTVAPHILPFASCRPRPR